MSAENLLRQLSVGARSGDPEELFTVLLGAYGPQQWWPTRSRFEIAVGAVLVQRTAWRNAELAIAALRHHGLLDPCTLATALPGQLAELVRPAGFATAKAGYLLGLARFMAANGGVEALDDRATTQLRSDLLAVRGVGPETADSILLYLFERPVWVADAYASRLFSRVWGETCDFVRQRQLLQPWVDAGRTADLQEFHALIVAHGKAHCRSRAHCEGCPLVAGCEFAPRAELSAKQSELAAR